MTDTVAAETVPLAAASQTKAPSKKKKAAPSSKPAGSKLSEQILKVVADGSDRKGMSLAAIKKALAAKDVEVEKRGSQIRFSVKRNVTNGSLKQIKGKGASGSFKVAEKETPGKVGREVKKSPAKKSPAKKSPAKKAAKKAAGCLEQLLEGGPDAPQAHKQELRIVVEAMLLAEEIRHQSTPRRRGLDVKSRNQQPSKRAPKRHQRQKKTAKAAAGKKAAAKKPEPQEGHRHKGEVTKKVEKPRAKTTPKSAKTKKAAPKKQIRRATFKYLNPKALLRATHGSQKRADPGIK
uniref:histone H1-like n=1 Tax=Pristiophorus japonicus TaxID=55135 RepID=UPI00398E5B5A